MTLNVQNVHRWLTHISAVAYDSLAELSMAFSSNADQINLSVFWNSGTGFGFCCSFC